jgi:hypothetical protein
MVAAGSCKNHFVTVNANYEIEDRTLGRKSIGERPMTAAERKRRQRERIASIEPRPGTVLDFRIKLMNLVETYMMLHPQLTLESALLSLGQLEIELKLSDYCRKNDKPHICTYLQQTRCWEHDDTNWQ